LVLAAAVVEEEAVVEEAVVVPLLLEAPAVLASEGIAPRVPVLLVLVPVPARKAKAQEPSEIVL
jgi:hypothetical protein